MGIHDNHRKRMRERYKTAGLDAFSEHEVLELLLYYAYSRKNVNTLAHALLNEFGSLYGVLSASLDELQQVDGVGEVTAFLLTLIPQVCKRAQLHCGLHENCINSSKKSVEYFRSAIGNEKEESVYQFSLRADGKLLTCKRIATGNASLIQLDTACLVKNAVLSSASSVILLHNHPSGNALPSQDDYAATKILQNVLQIVNVRLLDHIIVSSNGYYSMAESGFL